MASFPRVLVVPLCLIGVCLPCAAGPSINNNFSINVDDHLRQVYLDGFNITLPTYDDWALPDIIPLPDTTKVIAVLGWNLGQGASLVVSDLGGWVLTDALWKYSTFYTPKWYQTSFDDSAWNYTTVIKSANDGYGGFRFRCVSRHASLIWSPNWRDPKTDGKLYFRLRIQRDRLRRDFDLIKPDTMLSKNVKGCFRSRRLQCAASCSQMTSLCAGFQHNEAARDCCLLTVAQLNSSTQYAPGWNIWSSVVIETC